MKKKVEIEALNPIHGNVNYWSNLTFMAKNNRHQLTKAEEIIWNKILSYQKTGYKFTRQKPIHRFIVDFYCSKLNLAVEIDGSSHDKRKGYDYDRDKFLSQIGIKTVRFTNDEVINHLEVVNKKILELCPKPPLSRGGAAGGGVRERE